MTLKYSRRAATAILACLAGAQVMAVSAANPAPVWQPVAKIGGIVDLAGPRADGWLVAAGAGKLYLVDPLGAVTPFAQGPDGYADDKGAEAYLTVVPKLPAGATSGAACTWQQGDVYVLRLHAPLGLTKVDIHGVKSAFASIPNVAGLSGITFDSVGTFGYRLVVTAGISGGKSSEVAAIDCAGKVSVITRAAPVVEGGIEVAPKTFGSFGGMLIAPDELSGNIYAVGADGKSQRVAASGLPKGSDIGVEAVGFVPPAWRGNVYYSDRATPGNPHPGTDNVLMLDSGTLGYAGLQAGDLLSVTEGGTTLVAVRCAASCTVTPLITKATTAHGEGHLVFTNPPPAPSPSPSASPSAAAAHSPNGPDLFVVGVVIVALVVLVVAAVLVLLDLRGRRA